MKAEHFKTVGYAYPSSTTAKQHGYGATGCYYVRTGTNPDSDATRGTIEGVYETKAPALAHAERLRLDWSPLYLQANPEARAPIKAPTIRGGGVWAVDVDGCAVELHDDGAGLFSVVYGQQETTGLDYTHAAHEIGESILHALCNASRTERE